MKIIPASVPVARPVRKRAVPQAGDVVTACGCVCVPWPVLHLLGARQKSVLCDVHGWQAIKKPATLRERAGLGKVRPLPDEPMF